MVLRSPREDLEDLVRGIQSDLADIRIQMANLLPAGIMIPGSKFESPVSLLEQAVKRINRDVEQLRIRALRSLPW